MFRMSGGRQISGRFGAAACVLSLMLLTGCVSASLEDAAPKPPENPDLTAPANDASATDALQTGSAQQAADAASGNNSSATDTQFVDQGALRNRNFPTFANTPVGATEQMSANEKLLIEAEMSAIRDAYGSGGLSEAAYNARLRELKALARTHGDDAQDEIEN